MYSEDINYLVNHLFLPPKLPQEDDWTHSRSATLIQHVAESVTSFSLVLEQLDIDNSVRRCWRKMGDMIRSMQSLSFLVEHTNSCLKSFSDVLCFHISKQNAGLILRKSTTEILLEFFQASPTAAAVTGNDGKLIIQFPARPRLSIPVDLHATEALCSYLVYMDRMEMEDALPVMQQAGSKQNEHCEVADIRYISELLGGIARALTAQYSDIAATASNTFYVTKRINDHALWRDAFKPWRRDPQWLVVRVALQTTLLEWDIDIQYGYKAFITYVLTRALEKACKAGISHDLLYTLNAKIAARVWKLKFLDPTKFPFDCIAERNRTCAALLDDQWKKIQAVESLPLPFTPPTNDEIREAEAFSLTRCKGYLSTVFNRSRVLQSQNSRFFLDIFEASIIKNECRMIGSSPSAEIPRGGVDLWLAVLDIEHWIADDLPTWLTTTPIKRRLESLRPLITSYDTLASSFENPESFSRIFLILLELWVALDKTVIASMPLLAEYSPALAISSFEPLILPTLGQMRRLRVVEDYIQCRWAVAKYPQHSPFGFIEHQDCLAARYFNNDRDMQDLRDTIQLEATEEKYAKLEEYRNKNRDYNLLQSQYNMMEHEYYNRVTSQGRRRTKHTSSCKKCFIKRQIDNLKITIFEWPLPEMDILSRLVIFELRLPGPFSIWRDVTYRLAYHFSSSICSQHPSPTPILSVYPPLQKFFSPATSAQQITIASTAKSFLNSHYKECTFPCEQDAVIKKHPLRYQSYDVDSNEWLPSDFPVIDLRKRCTPTLPPGPYQPLTWVFESTGHTSNMIIARQAECSAKISYHEWDSFGHLRSGHRLQWRNIMLELAKETITLRDPAVYLLFRQAAWQVENRSDDDHRESHVDLANASFGREMLTILRERLGCICSNWQEGWSAATLSIIACRLLSLTTCPLIRGNALSFLYNLRRTLSEWMKQVLGLLRNRDPRDGLEGELDLRHRVIQLAAACRSTYAVELPQVTTIMEDPKSVSMFIECAMVLQNNVPEAHCSLPPPLRHIVERDVVLSVEVADILKRSIQFDQSSLDSAVSFVWQGFRRDTSLAWRVISDRWIACQTLRQTDADQTCFVHLNLFDGTLLVDGKTLGNLPKSILRHSLFRALFPHRFTMDIVPSTMKGMEYQMSNGLEVHFALTDDELVVRTRDIQTNTISEFVPAHQLQGDMPNSLLANTVHLFHETSQCLQFYPAPSGWNPSALPAWTMSFRREPLTGSTDYPELVKANSGGDRTTVLSPDSKVLATLHTIFRPLEVSIADLLVTETCPYVPAHHCAHPDRNLVIYLPRYNLSFFLGTEGIIGCRELPGMFVSKVQCIDTLFGLRSKLVLGSTNGNAPRKVLVPNGTIEVSESSRHPKPFPEVTITPEVTVARRGDASQHIRVFTYEVDELIGRITGDGTLTSWYLLAYLHILTSYFLRDPLTDRTGVQQALVMLESPNSFSFINLATEDVRLLRLIFNLTPVRNYYPSHSTSMETVHWHPILSPLSQHELFVPVVKAILDHGNDQALFQLNTGTPFKYEGKSVLRRRAQFRNSRLTSFEFYEEEESYCPFFAGRCLEGPDSAQSIEKEHCVARMVSRLGLWTANPIRGLWEVFRTWNAFSTRQAPVSFNDPSTWLAEPIEATWLSFFALCLSASRSKDVFGLSFALGILSYRHDVNIKVVHALLAVATSTISVRRRLQQAMLRLPKDEMINLDSGHTLEMQELKNIVFDHCIPFESSAYADLGEVPKVNSAFAYRSSRKEQCRSFCEILFRQWPCSMAQIPASASSFSLIDIPSCKESICNLFSGKFLNYCLFKFVREFETIINATPSHEEDMAVLLVCPRSPAADTPNKAYIPITLCSLIHSNDRPAPVPSTFEAAPTSSVRNLVSRLSERNLDGFSSRYTNDLLRCVDALEDREAPNIPHTQSRSMIAYATIREALRPRTIFEEVLRDAGMWPSLGTQSLLLQLSFRLRKNMPQDWLLAFVGYAEDLAMAQRRKRLAICERLGLEAERAKEAENAGGQGWDAVASPDWLLVQLDSNFLIRPVQASIARQMMLPLPIRNTVMQLNMGEGKLSVIVPIVSAALADGEQLVRVIVLKPLCAQMFHLLRQRICGLVNRRLFYLPFNRSVPLDDSKIRKIASLFKACASSGGVLLCQPEHILSFQLMCTHSLCNADGKADLLLETQRWLDIKTRDILDESDEILNVRYQLIYTIGTPTPLQNQPDRWQITQEVFSLLKDTLAETASGHPDGLEVADLNTERFPRTRILTRDFGCILLESIVRQIVFEERMPSTPFRSYPSDVRDLASKFLTEINISQTESDTLEGYSGAYFPQLLLLRGLIAHGILILSLREKRWRVDYGLDPSRSMLAVPYRAKDSPAPRAEFGHPDVIIVLTCLSYYYGGLSNAQLETTFRHLFNTDNPDLRYEDWIKGCLMDMPKSLCSLRGLNLDDVDQRQHHIFPRLRYNKTVIDFYLSEIVFPKEAKEFRHKLTTNSWDLAQEKKRLTTGFSGTNDHSYLLPLSIHQLDSSAQRHTNAQVLEYLLREENRGVVHIGSNGTALQLIERVVEQKPHAMVLLDVGAQVLELDNESVARTWLERDTNTAIETAIYCNATDDEFYVLTRDGRVELLARSFYRTQLNKTLVYLDEARTRGTDFKFPGGTRAVVTLGPKLSKDKLVQGCMRMRKLGDGHSVTFFASREIEQKIRASIEKDIGDLDSSDVLLWTMQETCLQIKDNGALWANQGLNFNTRRTAWDKFNAGLLSRSELSEVLQEPESRTLKELYGVRALSDAASLDDDEESPNDRRRAIKAKCEAFNIVLSGNTALLEEQERELAHEKEEERQVERVCGATPRDHFLDPALQRFVQFGSPFANSISLADCLRGTSHISVLGAMTKKFLCSTQLRATTDFANTIVLASGSTAGSMNDFLRPVQWILRSIAQPDVLLAVSPYEANMLLPLIRKSNYVRLHIYSARTTRLCRSFEDLDFLVVPHPKYIAPPLCQNMLELNLFAGQLFFRNQEAFRQTCCMLGLHLDEIPDHLKGEVDAGGYVRDEDVRSALSIQGCAFTASPVGFLRELIGWRRKGQSFALTHLGQILHGNNLKASEFQ
ncbi:hypothetical protein K439DRAFT_1552162 [Ramaria rubella]|nr:hypothetical protein K439DRAFT_1552162 [Ramaria rubella]